MVLSSKVKVDARGAWPEQIKAIVNTTVIKPQCTLESAGGFLKHNVLDFTLQIFDLISLRWDLINCIASKFSGDTEAASLKSQVENH